MSNRFKTALAGLGIAAAAFSSGVAMNNDNPAAHTFQFCEETIRLDTAQYMILREALIAAVAEEEPIDVCFFDLYASIHDEELNKEILESAFGSENEFNLK